MLDMALISLFNPKYYESGDYPEIIIRYGSVINRIILLKVNSRDQSKFKKIIFGEQLNKLN